MTLADRRTPLQTGRIAISRVAAPAGKAPADDAPPANQHRSAIVMPGGTAAVGIPGIGPDTERRLQFLWGERREPPAQKSTCDPLTGSAGG
jgi:hypothetical protein